MARKAGRTLRRLSIKPDATIIYAMDELSIETKREIVKLIFPDLRYGGDPDIERYFELRKAGRLGQALSIYNGALRVRYPDDAARVGLLKLYRENDPRYATYQEGLVLDFAEKISVRARRNIDIITAPLERADLSDALRALKAVESVLSRLPGETGGALALLERYDRFADILGYRKTLAHRALELVREYDAVSRSDAPADYDFVARSAALEEKRRAAAPRPGANAGAEESYDFVSRSAELEKRRKGAPKGGHGYFDPARIKFSEADRERVEISDTVSRREDKVLSFCAKYWAFAADPSFERTVFLYTRKYGGRHFEIFRAIKLGRARGATDDEILSAVSGILTTSYNYSVSGDLYMQIMWRRLRARMEARAVAERLAEPGPVATTRAHAQRAPKPTLRSRRAEGETEEELDSGSIPPPPAGDVAPVAPTSLPSSRSRARDLERLRSTGKPGSEGYATVSRNAARDTSPRAAREGPSRPSSRATDRSIPKTVPVAAPALSARPTQKAGAKERARAIEVPPSARASTLRPAAKAAGTRLLSRAPAGPVPEREIRAKKGSISDSIRKLSGRSYDVYREIFLEKVRDHIHRALLANQTRSHGLFDSAANEAEDQVYGFISTHYDDPFMDWERSAEREAVEALGFSMPSLQPIVESCFRKL
jgi:hypothetical protein